jgi:XTP/dITP diphosphohydrolase
MADFTFVTSNDHKVMTAKAVCDQFGLSFDRKNMDLVEIQSDSGAEIAEYKIVQAYEVYKSPVAITDDSWIIPGLNGFPGPYMKYMNQWLKPEDFLRLTLPLQDRSIVMRQVIVYKDAQRQKTFSADIRGTLMSETRGSSVIPHFTVISFDGGKHSVAEAEENGPTAITDLPNAWHQVCEWLKAD